MVRQIKTLSNTFAPLSIVILLVAALAAFNGHLSRGIGAAFPVLDPSLQISSISPITINEGSGSLIAGSAFKKQGSCSYLHGSLTWYLGSPDGLHVRAPIARFRDKPTIRGGGWTDWSGIIVGLEPWQVSGGSFATVRHNCPWWPWPITSTFYLSPSENRKTP